jgi:hypothetical protein
VEGKEIAKLFRALEVKLKGLEADSSAGVDIDWA